MRRREFVVGIASAAAWPLPGPAQERERLPRIGVLLPLGENDPEQMERRAGLLQGLERLGVVDGRSARIEIRYAAGGQARFEPLAKEMVALGPDVIFVQSTGFAAAVHRETRTIPVVFANVSDPLGTGFVESLARPGGNFTGLLLFENGVAAKWLAMLKEIAPGLRRAALIADPNVTPFEYFLRPAETVATTLGVEMVQSRVRTVTEVEAALDALATMPDSGFLVGPGSTMLRNRDRIIALAVRNRLPAVFPERVYAADGGLMSYGIADLIEPFRQAATYIHRILRGEKPGDLPVQKPEKFELRINLKAARALGVTPPFALLARADEVIE